MEDPEAVANMYVNLARVLLGQIVNEAGDALRRAEDVFATPI